MRQFFQSWRRKAGIYTLALTLVMMIGWLRSLTMFDEVRFHTATDMTDGFVSTDSEIGWLRRRGFEFRNGPSSSLMELFPGNPFVAVSGSRDPQISRWDWKWYAFGFGVGSADYYSGFDQVHGEHHSIVIVPYVSLVVPLTLLAAYLLFSKSSAASLTTKSKASAASHV